MISIIITCIISPCLCLFLVGIVDWSMHISQVKIFCDAYGYADYKIFEKYFQKYLSEMTYDDSWHSFFAKDYSTHEIHAGIIRFENKGMILDFISYLKFCYFMYKFKKAYTRKRIIKWK